MSAPDIHVVYVTVGSQSEAMNIANEVVAAHLAACCNIIPGVTSVYRWQGSVMRDEEWIIVMKTEQSRLAALTTRIKELHTYDCPCVVSWPLGQGNPAYLDWVVEQTR